MKIQGVRRGKAFYLNEYISSPEAVGGYLNIG